MPQTTHTPSFTPTAHKSVGHISNSQEEVFEVVLAFAAALLLAGAWGLCKLRGQETVTILLHIEAVLAGLIVAITLAVRSQFLAGLLGRENQSLVIGLREKLLPVRIALLGLSLLFLFAASLLPPADDGAVSPVFAQGIADRTAWENWFSGLSGPYHQGAEYWSAQRSLPNPGSCFDPQGHSWGEFTNGCRSAKQRLSPTDVRRRQEPDYRRGWNSY